MTKEAAEMLKGKKVVVFTGAGVSVESGIPTFRDKDDGLYKKYHGNIFNRLWFNTNPLDAKIVYNEILDTVLKANPNPGHKAISDLNPIAVVTTNVDSLHERAGSKKVIHLHGDLSKMECSICGRSYDIEDSIKSLVCENGCKKIMSPSIVMFGDSLNKEVFNDAHNIMMEAEVVLVVGASGKVEPAASLVDYARSSGTPVIEVNLEEAYYANIFIKGKSGEILPKIIKELR